MPATLENRAVNGGVSMRPPNRRDSFDELQVRVSSDELWESRTIEFKREFPANSSPAWQVAGFAVEGGVLMIAVEEPVSRFEVRCIGRIRPAALCGWCATLAETATGTTLSV